MIQKKKCPTLLRLCYLRNPTAAPSQGRLPRPLDAAAAPANEGAPACCSRCLRFSHKPEIDRAFRRSRCRYTFDATVGRYSSTREQQTTPTKAQRRCQVGVASITMMLAHSSCCMLLGAKDERRHVA